MADSGSLRVQRHRQHKAGNHSLCKPRFCEFAQVVRIPVKVSQVPAASGKDFDPREAMTALAAQLRAACEASPADAVLAREYRLTLMELAKDGDRDGPDPFAELLAELSGPVPAKVGDSED